jgi:hypothetical protein
MELGNLIFMPSLIELYSRFVSVRVAVGTSRAVVSSDTFGERQPWPLSLKYMSIH